MIRNKAELESVLARVLDQVTIVDMHTHLFPAQFSGMLLWGIDELVTYHYLVAEYFRCGKLSPPEFYALPKTGQADLIWQTLFLDRSPISEAQRGILTVLQALGLEMNSPNLESQRRYFATLSLEEHISKVFALSGIEKVVMTNDPFDPVECAFWQSVPNRDDRFLASLRLDPLLVNYADASQKLRAWGYAVGPVLDQTTGSEIRRFLKEWIGKIKAVYLAASLPPDFAVGGQAGAVLENCILPVCAEFDLPFAPMIGVKKLINPELGLAGDSVGKADIGTLEYLCAKYPDNKFLVTMLSRENQHELAITARKYNNLLIFGCWWFLNNPSLVREITSVRLETLGLSFIPQHSDARVLEQVIYKWRHFKATIARVLLDKYEGVMATGWRLTEADLTRDCAALFAGNFLDFVNRAQKGEEHEWSN